MPRTICKQIICGPERAEAVADDAAVVKADPSLNDIERKIVGGIEATAVTLAKEFDMLRDVEVSSYQFQAIETLFVQFEECARGVLVEILTTAVDET